MIDDLKLIESVLKDARLTGRRFKYGGMKRLADSANDALDALERVRADVAGRQLGLWDMGPQR